MLMPGLYTDPVEEYWHLVNHVTLWDVGVERQVEIDGPDGFEFMQLLTPRDMEKCAVGECKYVLLTTPQGGIINDPVLLRLGENHFWLSLSDWDVLFWCKGVAVNAGLDVVVREPDVSPLQLQGPKSKDVMVDLFGEEILGLEYYHLTETELDGIPLVITRTGWSAERGYELYLRDSKFGEKLWDAVMAAGSKYEIRPIAPSEIRRIEAGILNYSSDIMLDNNPYEVGLGWTVDEDKRSDYLGKAAIARVKGEGVKRKLVGIEVAGEPLGAWIPDYWDGHADDRRVGHVTSLTYSPRLEKNIGYALVGIDHAKIGTRLRVSTTNGVRSASVVKKPFVDPKKDIPKS
ncbi:MAG: glycine cleavage system protein T [Methanobacteriota archaeon]|nr:MAG: glycine cleavage system protein T [Euryarchaeota archaeon]